MKMHFLSITTSNNTLTITRLNQDQLIEALEKSVCLPTPYEVFNGEVIWAVKGKIARYKNDPYGLNTPEAQHGGLAFWMDERPSSKLKKAAGEQILKLLE